MLLTSSTMKSSHVATTFTPTIFIGVYCWFLLLLVHLPTVAGDLVYPVLNTVTNATTYRTIPSYSVLMWNYHFNEPNLTVIDLMQDHSTFNYCDLTAFTPQGILPLMNKYYNISQADLDGGLKWIALYKTSKCIAEPNGSLQMLLVTTWWDYMSLYIQNTGATGFLVSYDVLPFKKLNWLDGVDKKNGIVYGQPATNIFAACMLSADASAFTTAKNVYLKKKLPFVISVQDSFDANDVWFQPIGFFFYFYRIINALTVFLCFWAFVDSCSTTRKLFQVSSRNKATFAFGFTSLSFSVIGNIIRLISFIDPSATYGILSYQQRVILRSLGQTFHISSTLASICIWMDTIISLKAALKMQFKKSVLLESLFLKLLFLVISIVFIVVNLAFTISEDYYQIYWIPTASLGGEDPIRYAQDVCYVFLAAIQVLLSATISLTVFRMRAAIAEDEGNQQTPAHPSKAATGDTATATGVQNVVTTTTASADTTETTARANNAGITSSLTSKATTTSHGGGGTTNSGTGGGGNRPNQMKKLTIAAKMHQLGVRMTLSGCMMVITIPLGYLYGSTTYYYVDPGVPNHPYLVYVLGVFPIVLIQISSILEVSAIKLILDKHQEGGKKPGAAAVH